MINQYYCIIFLQRLSPYYILSESFSFSEHFDSSLQSGLLKFFLISMIIYSGVLFMAIFWHRKFLSSYFLLLNLSSMVRFSQNMTVLQLAVISLILLSLFVCQTLRYDVDSLFFYYFVQDTKRLYMSNDKCIYQ